MPKQPKPPKQRQSRTITGDEVKAAIQVVKSLPLDIHDSALVEHIEKGGHGWWYETSRMKVLEIIASKHGNFNFMN